MRYIVSGILKDKEIVEALREAADGYENGEIVETRNVLMAIVDAIDTFLWIEEKD